MRPCRQDPQSCTHEHTVSGTASATAAAPVKIAVAGLKGGSGQTTTAVFLALLLARDGPTLAVDADPQQSLSRWAARAGDAWELPLSGQAVPDMHKHLARLVRGYEHVVIDCPPLRPEITRSAVLSADLVLVPMAPNLIELDRLAPTLETVNEVWHVHEPVIRALLVKGRAGTRSRDDARTALAEFNVSLLAAEVPMREVYAQSFGTCPPNGGHYEAVLTELREAVP